MNDKLQMVCWYLLVAILAWWMISHNKPKVTGPVLMLTPEGCQYYKDGKFLIPVLDKNNNRVCV